MTFHGYKSAVIGELRGIGKLLFIFSGDAVGQIRGNDFVDGLRHGRVVVEILFQLVEVGQDGGKLLLLQRRIVNLAHRIESFVDSLKFREDRFDDQLHAARV